MDEKGQYILDLFEKNSITISKQQAQQFFDYYCLLIEWNSKINLTAITEFQDVCLKHFLDCSAICFAFSSYSEAKEFFSGKTLIDVGTGAGFPGIPLKILFPELKLTLADSLEKRVRFLNEVVSKLGLESVTTIHGRAEDLAHDIKLREQFDFSTARAVAALPVLSEYCVPFVKREGLFIAYKSEKAEEEITSSKRAFSLLGVKLEKSKVFFLDGSEMKRNILFIKKISSTSKAYPRKAGTPSKNPL